MGDYHWRTMELKDIATAAHSHKGGHTLECGASKHSHLCALACHLPLPCFFSQSLCHCFSVTVSNFSPGLNMSQYLGNVFKFSNSSS